ncbi:MAG: class I SAM-dependent methyltransferase [Ruminococcus flavefaciens]|nr:class I SAM-dependent methyltransferase [Ruminococcus flavefaciens]
MKISEKELSSYKVMRRELEEQLYLLGLLEQGCLLRDNGEILSENYELMQDVVSRYGGEEGKWWKSRYNWQIDHVFPERAKKQKELLEAAFIPYLNKEQKIADLACANGSWTRYVAPYVGWVDGFEYSENMVQTAKSTAAEKKIENVAFYQADACSLQFENKYDNFMMMGLLTNLSKSSDAEHVVGNVANALKPDGRLVIKDTLNLEDEEGIYLYNKVTGYMACYRSIDKYHSYFENAGFKMEYEICLEEMVTDGIRFMSTGEVWIKK